MTRSLDCTSCDTLNPARISAGTIIGGGIPIFNEEDGAIGSSPSKANFLSSLQRTLQDKGFAPASLYGFSAEPQPWYRPDLQPSPDARKDSWNDYLDGVNMGTYRGGILGLLAGGGVMLAALYFGGLMTSSPKAAPAAAKPQGAIATAKSHHRSPARKGR